MAKKTKLNVKKSNSAKPKKTAKKAPKKTKPVAKANKKVLKPVKKPLSTKIAKKVVVKATKNAALKDTQISKSATKDSDKVTKTDVKQQIKSALKSAPKSKLKTKKVEKKEDDFDDDLIDDDFGESEIAEYEDDLKAVEEDDDDLTEDLVDDDDIDEKETEVYLTDSEGRRLCRVRDCDQVSGVEGYCRFHYLLLWKKIQIRKVILIDGKLEKYIEDLTGRYPDKFLEMIKKDMKSEKDFLSAIHELEIDESALGDNDADEDVQSYAEEIRGVTDAPVIDDDGDY